VGVPSPADDADRVLSVRYPDLTTLRYTEYDTAFNPTRVIDPRGNQIEQVFDQANRLRSRQIAPATGVEGVTSESFSYDGLGRLTALRVRWGPYRAQL
jgi:YD repeat-containing protein